MSRFIQNKIKTSKRVKTIFYLLDNSGSMNNDGKIGALNQAMRDSIQELKSKSETNTAAIIKIAVLAFCNNSYWIYDAPIDIADFPDWEDIKAGGVTDLGDAMIRLNAKLTNEKGGFLYEKTSSFSPSFILISDGQPTDDWESALKNLKNNKWFNYGEKIALAVGDSAQDEECLKVLSSFTGQDDAVIKIDNSEALIKMIKFVTMVLSEGGNKDNIIEVINYDSDNLPEDAKNNF